MKTLTKIAQNNQIHQTNGVNFVKISQIYSVFDFFNTIHLFSLFIVVIFVVPFWACINPIRNAKYCQKHEKHTNDNIDSFLSTALELTASNCDLIAKSSKSSPINISYK